MFDLNSRARYYTLGALVCVAAATLAPGAHAQNSAPADSASRSAHGGWGDDGWHHHMQHGGRRHGNPMLRDLDLTRDQRAKVQLIHDRYRLKADSLRLGGAAHDSASRTKFHSMMTQEMGEIRGVLTPDQKKKFDDRMAKMKERMAKMKENHAQHGGGNPPPPAPPQ